MQQLNTLHCDPLIVRSVPHMRSGGHKLKEGLDGPFGLSAHAVALGVQLGEMLGDASLRAHCQVEAASRIPSTTKEGDAILLALCVDADDPDALAKHMSRQDHLGAYVACRTGYAALRQKRPDILQDVIDRMADETGVIGKLMNMKAERTLMIAGLKWLETGNVPLDIIYPVARSLPGHMAQGLILDIHHLFYSATFGQA